MRKLIHLNHKQIGWLAVNRWAELFAMMINIFLTLHHTVSKSYIRWRHWHEWYKEMWNYHETVLFVGWVLGFLLRSRLCLLMLAGYLVWVGTNLLSFCNPDSKEQNDVLFSVTLSNRFCRQYYDEEFINIKYHAKAALTWPQLLEIDRHYLPN